jgi:glycosyltransferase involved in cell wall biosynthesis
MVTPKYPPQAGGASHVFSLVGEHIKDELEYIEVFTSTYDGAMVESRSGIKVTRLFPYIEEIPSKVIFAPFTFTTTFLYFLLNFRKFDIVESHTVGEISIFSQFFARLFRKKLIKHVIDMQTSPLLLRHPYAEAYECCGQTIAKKLRGIGIPEEMVNDINLPIIRSHKSPNQKKGIKKFVFIGELSRQKGIHDIIELLSETKENFEIIFIGSGPLQGEVQQLAEEDARVKYLGHIPHEQVMDVLSETHVLIHPTYNDVMPLSILEAMMMGNVILSTDIGEIKKVVGNGGIIIRPGDRVALKAAFLKLMKSDLTAMRKAAMRNFEEYVSHDIYKMHAEVLRKVSQ